MEVFQLNNQEPKSRVQRYNFNDVHQPPRRHRQQRRWWPWLMTLLTLAIAVLLVLAINTHQSSSSRTATASSADASLAAKSSSTSQQSAYDQFETKYKRYLSNGTLTLTQKQKLQESINNEDNSAVQSREQKLLNQAEVKRSSSSSNAATSSANSTQKAQQSQNASSFDTPHTFSSVADAQNWAQASKSQWLQAGYSTYTITSDGQGNYNLQFVR